jgi:hypothetical protein
VSLKGADEWYLLGKAYMGLGKKEEAYKAWTEAILINKKASKRKRWTFLFPPNKPLKGKQKKKLKEDFEDEYRELNAAVSRAKELKARDLKNKATRTDLDAKRVEVNATRKDAREEQLNKLAAAKSKTINSKQRMADRRARSGKRSRNTRPVRRRGSSVWVLVIVGVIFGLIIVAVLFGRRRRGGGRDVVYYDVGYDDHPFDRGAFYYQGHYFANQAAFYGMYGYYYTNSMYRDNYSRWGSGQAYDERLDQEIQHDIHEREELYGEAAQAGYEADMMRADAGEMRVDADHMRQDAVELEQEMSDGDAALAAFDEEDHFEDDEFEDDEFEDDGEFEDDFEDDGYADAGGDEFEDDPEA